MGEGERSRAETPAHNISGRQKENRGGTAGTLGKNQGGKERVVRHFESVGELSQLSQLHLWVLLSVVCADPRVKRAALFHNPSYFS
jgi:hypothetical protein